MNANRNTVIDFGIITKWPDGRLTGRHDHYIRKKKGKSVQGPHATHKRRHIVKKGRRIV